MGATLKNPFKREKPTLTSGEAGLISGMLQGEGRTVDEREIMEQLGINIHILDDDEVNKIIENLSKKPVVNDGKIVGYVYADLNMLAIRLACSKRIRSSFLDPIDAEIGELQARKLIKRVEMGMDEEQYEFGGTNFLEAALWHMTTAWSDSKQGRKAKLLKMLPRTLEVAVPKVKEEK